jgi:hypothetical protein
MANKNRGRIYEERDLRNVKWLFVFIFMCESKGLM